MHGRFFLLLPVFQIPNDVPTKVWNRSETVWNCGKAPEHWAKGLKLVWYRSEARQNLQFPYLPDSMARYSGRSHIQMLDSSLPLVLNCLPGWTHDPDTLVRIIIRNFHRNPGAGVLGFWFSSVSVFLNSRCSILRPSEYMVGFFFHFLCFRFLMISRGRSETGRKPEEGDLPAEIPTQHPVAPQEDELSEAPIRTTWKMRMRWACFWNSNSARPGIPRASWEGYYAPDIQGSQQDLQIF